MFAPGTEVVIEGDFLELTIAVHSALALCGAPGILLRNAACSLGQM